MPRYATLYWKIFLSFWLATILIIITTAWVTHQIAHKNAFLDTIDVALCLALAVCISGIICYLLSVYVTSPLNSLSLAAQSLATGKLHTRIGPVKGHSNDEIADVSNEFDRMAEQLEHLIHSKERLLQDISHELRSPIARLNIAIELGRKKTNHLADAEFNRMEIESSRLNLLIGEILEFARLEKSSNKINPQTINVQDLLAEIISDGNYESRSDRIIVETIQPCTMLAERRLIHRALENVVRNALNYTPLDKKIRISLISEYTKKQIQIKIKDNGPGVPEDQLKNIFNPFYRVDSSRTKNTGGYGLGLAIAERAISLHQGEISAMNNNDGGLLVQITLPIKPQESI